MRTRLTSLTSFLHVLLPEALEELVEHGDRLLLGRLRDIVDHRQAGVIYPELGQEAGHAATRR